MLKKTILVFLFLSCVTASKLGFRRSRTRRSVNEEITKSHRPVSTFLPFIKSNFLESDDKVQVFNDYLDLLSKYGNVTVVGWQNIENENDPAFVRTIEFTIPHDDTPVVETDLSKNIDEDNLFDMADAIYEHRDNLQSELNGVKLAITIEKYYRDGIFDGKLYLDDRDKYYSEDSNVNLLLRSLTVDTYVEAKEIVKRLHGTYKPVHVAVMNEKKELVGAEGHLVPELVAKIVEQDDANIQTMEMALKISVVGYYLNSTDVLNYVSRFMGAQYPKYTWEAVEGSPYNYISKDMTINIEFPYEDYSLTIFGNKK